MIELIAEAATGHGGDLDIAADMVRAAADSGADWVKFQTYDLAKLNPSDPQKDWLTQAHLDKSDHEFLIRLCEQVGIKFLSTPFDAGSLQMLRDLGLSAFKIASTESGKGWWGKRDGERWFVSFPWGRGGDPIWGGTPGTTQLTAIPLYPTPLEVVGHATLLEGYSCHAEGIAVCQWALARGATVIEAHLALGKGRGRQTTFDKLPHEFRQVRDFADACETMRSGVSTTFRRRWSA